MSWPSEPVTVVAPASSANVGPGFDSLALALGLHDTVVARIVPTGTVVEVFGTWPGNEPDMTEDNLIIRAMRAGFAAFGGAQPPGIEISCRSAIPQGFGLGSSAAAIVAGLLAARELAARRGDAVPAGDAVLRLAAELEGHPDNVAACLLGGLTISWKTAGGVRAARLAPLPELAPVLCVPASPVLTETARKALPALVPHADAAANSARSALLVAALTGRPDLLLAGTQDFLHQSYRAAAMPGSLALVERLRAAGIAAVLSGAGPSVLALVVTDSQPGPAEVARIAARAGPVWQVLPLKVDAQGAVLLAA